MKYIWQLPQTLVALLIILFLYLKKELLTEKFQGITRVYLPKGTTFCFSLGEFIFAAEHATLMTISHEYGHSKQSRYLGFLYLIAVGLPSLCLFWWKRIFKKDQKWYVSHYPENWADKLGGVVR